MNLLTATRANGKSKNQVIKEIEIRNPGRFGFEKLVYSNSQSPIILKCIKHNIYFTVKLGNLFKPGRHGCKSCLEETRANSAVKLSKETYIKRCIDIYDDDMFDFTNFTYNLIKSDIKNIKCNSCGEFFNINGETFLRGNGHPHCRIKLSKGENIIDLYLHKQNIEHIHQHKFSDCKNKFPLPFDYYLPNLNTCVEFDGVLHYKDSLDLGKNCKWINSKNINDIQFTDNIKNNYCINNNINLLRISYKLNIRSIKKLLSKTIINTNNNNQ